MQIMNSEICKQCKYFKCFTLIEADDTTSYIACYCLSQIIPTFASENLTKEKLENTLKNMEIINKTHLKHVGCYTHFTEIKPFCIKGSFSNDCLLIFEHCLNYWNKKHE